MASVRTQSIVSLCLHLRHHQAAEARLVPFCTPAGAIGRRDVAVLDEWRIEQAPAFALSPVPLPAQIEILVIVGIVDAAAGYTFGVASQFLYSYLKSCICIARVANKKSRLRHTRAAKDPMAVFEHDGALVTR
jgi:hypothetical protein